MTEVPDHLLERSRAARARLTGEGGDAPAGDSAPAASAAVEAAPAAAAPVASAPAEIEKPPEPVPPFVQAALERKKVPSWAFFIVLMLPIWAFFYVGTLERPPEEGILSVGGEVYATNCSGCHGASGGGGSGPALAGGEVAMTFPDAASQIWWVVNGSTTAGTPYGNPNRNGGQRIALEFSGARMPNFGANLSAIALLEAIYYERVTHGQVDPDSEDLHAIEHLVEHPDDFELPANFVEGITIAEIQALLDEVTAELEAG